MVVGVRDVDRAAAMQMQTHEPINKSPPAHTLESVNGVWSVQLLAGCMQFGEIRAEEKHDTHSVYPASSAQRGQGRVEKAMMDVCK